ncbi:MAG: glycosyltransferase family 39 protein [Anaerolineae bacterium]|nr:glycosyltransferase family 39 protein [Anaerolineae bacterium]
MNDKITFLPRKLPAVLPTLLILGLVVVLTRLFLFPFIYQDPQVQIKALKTDHWGSIARNLADGYGYTSPNHENPKSEVPTPTAIRGPVPVLWFAGIFSLFGYKLWPVMIGNWLLDVGTAVVLFFMARYLFPQKPGVAVLAVLIYAFYLPAIWVSYPAYSEPIFTLLLMLHLLTMLHLLNRPSLGRAALAGLWLGLAALSRPIALIFPALVFGLMMLQYRRFGLMLKYFGLLAVTFAVVLSPWIIRNYLTFNAFIPSTTLGGVNLLWEHYYLDTSDYLRHLAPENVIEAEMERVLKARGDNPANYDVVSLDKFYSQEAVSRILHYPGRYLVLSANRFLYLWFYDDFVERPDTHSWFETLVVAVPHAALLIMLVIGFIWERRVRTLQFMPLYLSILFFTLVHVLTHAQPRYIVPVMPLVILLAALTIYEGLIKFYPFRNKGLQYLRGPI